MRPPPPAAVADNRESGDVGRRRRRRLTAAPSAPAASASASALASCLAALILNTTGDSTALATAFLIGDGGGFASPACFLHPAAAAPQPSSGYGSAVKRFRARRGEAGAGRSATSCVPGFVGETAARPIGLTDVRVSPSGRQICSQLAAWGRGSGSGSGSAGGVAFRIGEADRQAAVASGEGFWASRESRRDRGRGRERLIMLAGADVEADGGGGDAVGVAGATETTEAAAGAATGGEGGGGDSGAVDATALQLRDLEKMKVAELKVLYRESGGKPGTLRKAELVERLSRSMQQSLPTGASAASGGPELLPEAGAAAAAPLEPPSPPAEDPTVVPLPPRVVGGEEGKSASSLFSVLNGSGAAADLMTAGQEEVSVGDDGRFATKASAPAGAASGLRSSPGEAAAEVAEDLFSSGPAAVVAAARARGAAAAAASSRVAAEGRVRAMEAARRHAESVRTRASQIGSSSQSASLEGTQQWQQKSGNNGASTPTTAVMNNGAERLDGVAGATGGIHTGPTAMATAPAPAKVTVTAPGAAAVAAVAKAAKVEAAAARAAAISMSMPSGSSSPGTAGGGRFFSDDRSSGPGGRGTGGRHGAGATAGRGKGGVGGGRRGEGRPGADGGAWNVLVESPVARRTGPRQPKLARMDNPWSRGGLGREAEGTPEEGDVLDAFLADTMIQTPDDREASGDPLFDRESRFGNCLGAPMQLTFLGTASCIPSTSRGVSCTVLRNEGDLWLFDVGEGTQIQIQKSSLKPTRITKIFITHAHGDHSFGLPGLLCLMGVNFDRTDGRRVEIYGPTGLRAYLRAAIQYTYSKSVCPYVVHELTDVPYLHGDFSQQPEPFDVKIARDNRYGEQNGGRNFYPDKNGHFELFRDEKLTVRAAPMKHGVPCIGFVVEEADRPGRLRAEEVNPILREHKKAIVEATGRKDVSWILGWIKSTKRGEILTLPGTNVTINSADYVGVAVKGRKVVILGDTCDAGSMVPLAMGADVVVHEATNTWLPPLDQGKTYADVETEAIKHGHSTPAMAAAFAQKVEAKMLILNHFSARYRGDPSDSSVAAMLRIERQARRAGGFERHQVVASWDLLMLPVVDADQWEANLATAREADAAFDAELLRRAQEWQAEEDERERSQDVVVDVDVAPDDQEKERRIADGTASSASTGSSSLNGRGPTLQGKEERTESLAGGASSLQGDGGDSSHATQANAAGAAGAGASAANIDLVGIMFDAAV